MMLFLFWFIRIACLVCFLINIIVVDVHNLSTFIFFIFGLIASVNIYGMGLLAHETYKSLPSLFILFRGIQLLLIISTKQIEWRYLALYVILDIFVFVLFVYDNKYQFVLKEEGAQNVKTIVDRGDNSLSTEVNNKNSKNKNNKKSKNKTGTK